MQETISISSTTCVPDMVFDELLTILTGNELKVLLYIIRRTFGFGKESDAISLTQFKKGITTQDGKVLDKGCGIEHNKTLLVALVGLQDRGLITAKKRKTKIGDDDVTVYKTMFKIAAKVTPQAELGMRVVTSGNPQENSKQKTDLQKTDLQETTNVASASSTRPRQTTKTKMLSLESYDFNQEASIERVMQLADIWRGTPLPQAKRADSDYNKALTSATALTSRMRSTGKPGYTLREIDTAYRYFKRIAPEDKPYQIAEEWWKGKNVDLWVIAKNIDKALDEIESKSQTMKASTETSAPEQEPQVQEEDLDELVLYSEHKFRGREFMQYWYMYRYMTRREAKQYGFVFPLGSSICNFITNKMDHHASEIPALREEYEQKHLALAI